MLSTLLIVNIIISVLHSIKHVPQCMYMIEHKNADGLSMRYIQGEILLNVLSSMVTFHLFCVLHHAIYLIPVLLEKTTALTMIVTMFYLKKKYSHNDDDGWRSVDSDFNNEDDWRSVDSEFNDEDDWRSVDGDFNNEDDWRSVDSEYE